MSERALKAAIPALAVATSVLLCFLLLAASRQHLGVALDAFGALLWGAVGHWPRFVETGDAGLVLRPLGEAGVRGVMLLLTGLAVTAALRVGLFNIGAQGQLVVGALCAAVVGAWLALPPLLHLLVALLAAATAGALWASLAAVLKLWRGVHEVISTIMLNWVAVSLVEGWLVVGPLRAQVAGQSIASTPSILPTAELPVLLGQGSRLNAGLLVASLMTAGLWWFLARTVRGYEWRAVGLAPDAARAAGIPVQRVVLEAMAVSGALAGLAGGVLVLGTEHRYPGAIATPWGFDGIAMALLGQAQPLTVGLVSLLFGALKAGGARMQLYGVHKSFPDLIQGLSLLLVAAPFLWRRLLRRASP